MPPVEELHFYQLLPMVNITVLFHELRREDHAFGENLN